MNQYGFAEFLGPVWTFCSFLTIQVVFRKERLDAIFFLSLVSLIVCLWEGVWWTCFPRFLFVKKGFCIPVSWFKVWCLGNNICEKYAFTFIQHSRSTLWLISTEAYNYPERCKFRLFAQNHAGFLFSRPIRSKEIFLLKYGIRELKASLSIKLLISEFSSP